MHRLVLVGELDRASASTLEAEIERLCEAGSDGITLDLSELAHIDQTGVAVIAFRCGLCERRGHDFALIPGSASVQRAFELAGVVDRLPFQGHAERALPTSPVPEPRSPADAPADAHPRVRARSATGRRAPTRPPARLLSRLRLRGGLDGAKRSLPTQTGGL